jgi:hypothetical protein
MTAFTKLPAVLPRLVGKTIARTMLVFHKNGHYQLWQFYTDGSAYEFYGSGPMSGARSPDRTAIETVYRSVLPSGAEVLLAPDRRKVPR